MNYYILTSEVFESLDKDQIRYAHKSQDKTKYVVATADNVSDTIITFNNIAELSTYTFNNNTEWVGDASGIEEWEIEEIEYLNGL